MSVLTFLLSGCGAIPSRITYARFSPQYKIAAHTNHFPSSKMYLTNSNQLIINSVLPHLTNYPATPHKYQATSTTKSAIYFLHCPQATLRMLSSHKLLYLWSGISRQPTRTTHWLQIQSVGSAIFLLPH